MTDRKETLIAWLRDAHAMEEQAQTMLNAQRNRLVDYPDLRDRIERHIAETEEQAATVAALLGKMGANPSTMKDFTGKFTAAMQGLGGATMSDEVVKGSLASYAFEHLEIATYKALVAAAEACGELDAARALRGILDQEVEMANWLSEHLPPTVRTFLDRAEATGPDAGRTRAEAKR